MSEWSNIEEQREEIRALSRTLPERVAASGDLRKALEIAQVENAVSGSNVSFSADFARTMWQNYLSSSETYGTFHNRTPEYMMVARELFMMGLQDDDSVLDVGAGTCDMDHYLRMECNWRGRYIPIDGTIDGTDLNFWEPSDGLRADWVVSIETIEHVFDPKRLVDACMKAAKRGVVFTTPNADVVDVIAVDHTHFSAITTSDLREWTGGDIATAEFSGRGDKEKGWDTIICVVDLRPEEEK